jgi:hypothetical protein
VQEDLCPNPYLRWGTSIFTGRAEHRTLKTKGSSQTRNSWSARDASLVERVYWAPWLRNMKNVVLVSVVLRMWYIMYQYRTPGNFSTRLWSEFDILEMSKPTLAWSTYPDIRGLTACIHCILPLLRITATLPRLNIDMWGRLHSGELYAVMIERMNYFDGLNLGIWYIMVLTCYRYRFRCCERRCCTCSNLRVRLPWGIQACKPGSLRVLIVHEP